MVHVSPETVASFKKMFKEQYGVEYSDVEVWGLRIIYLGFLSYS